MPGAIRGKNGATPPRNTVVCQRKWTELGRGHHCAPGFTENLGLFEVPIGRLWVGSRPPRTVRGPAHGGLSPARCGPPPFLLNSHSEGRSTQSAVGLSNSCSLNQEWVPSFNANPPRIGGCILQLDQTSPQASTGSCRERVHRKQQVRSSPVVPRHDPLHELIEHRHREGGVAVIGAPDHALGDQGAACRSQ